MSCVVLPAGCRIRRAFWRVLDEVLDRAAEANLFVRVHPVADPGKLSLAHSSRRSTRVAVLGTWRSMVVVGLAMLFAASGCGTGVPEVAEPNDTFLDAVAAIPGADGSVRVSGTISKVGDLDVFAIGEVLPGDRLIVNANSTGSPLDLAVAVFDDAERLVYNNDDRGGSTIESFDPYLEWIARHAGSKYYLVVSHSPFAPAGWFTGSYAVDVEVSPGFEVPNPVGQILLLDFDGGMIDSAVLGLMTIEPFDAGAISQVYEGMTEDLKDAIRDTVIQNYRRFNVTILTSDEVPADSDITSIVYFGGFSRNAFGLAEQVDLYNNDFCDDALIYTESFAPSVFSYTPTVAELGAAIGNVAAHEAGHLLGLNHVSDDRALMDDYSVADALMDDQEFMEAPLSGDVMPIGTQDAVRLLDEIVGPLLIEHNRLRGQPAPLRRSWPRL